MQTLDNAPIQFYVELVLLSLLGCNDPDNCGKPDKRKIQRIRARYKVGRARWQELVQIALRYALRPSFSTTHSVRVEQIKLFAKAFRIRQQALRDAARDVGMSALTEDSHHASCQRWRIASFIFEDMLHLVPFTPAKHHHQSWLKKYVFCSMDEVQSFLDQNTKSSEEKRLVERILYGIDDPTPCYSIHDISEELRALLKIADRISTSGTKF